MKDDQNIVVGCSIVCIPTKIAPIEKIIERKIIKAGETLTTQLGLCCIENHL